MNEATEVTSSELIQLGDCAYLLARAYKQFQRTGNKDAGWERLCKAIPTLADSILRLTEVKP